MRILLLVCMLCVSGITIAKDFPFPGTDGYQQMIRMLGQPKLVEKTPDGHNYIYSDVVVNIGGEAQSKIKSISFFRPNIYTVYPGLDVGMTKQQLLMKISDSYVHQSVDVNFITDYQRGLIFWMERDRVVKLVQVQPGTLKRIKNV